METLEKRKTNLRKQMKVLLKEMNKDEKANLDHMVCERVLELPEISEAGYIYAYMALSWETGTMEILKQLWERGIKVALPKVLGSEMEFFEVRSAEDLEEGSFHILEPRESCPMIIWPEAVIMVPGLAFSKEGKRLGKGGGYYDKYLSKYPGHQTVALAYEFQVLPELPAEEHDQPVDYLITDSRTISCKNFG